jgi:hypothetical protein
LDPTNLTPIAAAVLAVLATDSLAPGSAPTTPIRGRMAKAKGRVCNGFLRNLSEIAAHGAAKVRQPSAKKNLMSGLHQAPGSRAWAKSVVPGRHRL